jgi:hypothetical protein
MLAYRKEIEELKNILHNILYPCNVENIDDFLGISYFFFSNLDSQEAKKAATK